MTTTIAQLDALRERLNLLRQAGQFLTSGDFLYTIERFAAAYDLLISRYAPFKVGDRVRLTRTPNITENTAPGWLGSKHFLVAGALCTVKQVEVVPPADLRFAVAFDTESWIDRHGMEQQVEPERRHVYSFREGDLEKAQEVTVDRITSDTVREWFKRYHDEYLHFERIAEPRHRRPDLCAFLLLADALPPDDRKMVGAAEHDEIGLEVTIAMLANVATPDLVRDLVRCGVRVGDNGWLCMYA